MNFHWRKLCSHETVKRIVLRIANQLGNDYKDNVEVRIFLIADAATCAIAGQEILMDNITLIGC